jgi:phage terminase large subunit
MAETRVIPYAPRRVFLPFHNRTQRFAIGVAHRRCGKTVACINDMIRNAVVSDKPHYRAAYLAPYLKQAKDVAWEYLKRYSQPIWAKPPNESELYVELIGGKRIKIYGADNPDALRGGYLDDATLDEYADMYPGIFGSIIRPMLADRQGTATFIGTPKGRNAFFDLFERAKTDPDWFPFFLPASETGILPQSELTAAAKEMTPEQYEQEFECSFEAAIIGAYYGRDMAESERAGRITDVPYDPALPVYTTWDLGIGDSTAIWFWQALGAEIRVIDFYEASGESIEHYAKVLQAKPYKYETDWVPHDARVRELGTGRTRIETMLTLKLKPKLVPNHKVLDGINAGRVLFPRIWFDREKCKAGLECLRQYRADYDDKARVFRDGPKHDWTSHAADAFRYLAMAYREIKPEAKAADGPVKGIRDMTWDDLLANQPVHTGYERA